MNAAIIAALRAHAAGLHPEEAGTELLIGHGSILPRDDFAGFVHTGTSISDGTTLISEGEFIPFAAGQAGVKFLPASNSNAAS